MNGPFAQSLCQAQILILEICQYIPAVKIFAFLDLEQNCSTKLLISGWTLTSEFCTGYNVTTFAETDFLQREVNNHFSFFAGYGLLNGYHCSRSKP
jgi:hypothetical protein